MIAIVDSHIGIFATIAVIAACQPSGSANQVLSPALPEGSPPTVMVAPEFGDSPLAGQLIVQNALAAENWRYEVDLDADGVGDTTGIVSESITIPFRFETPGHHEIIVRLFGTGKPITERRIVTVNDASVLALVRGQMLPPPVVGYGYRGIAVRHGDGTIYVSDGTESIYRLDPNDLIATGRIEVAEAPEGLSIAPSDSLLFATHLSYAISVISLPQFQVVRSDHIFTGRHFIHALDDRRILASGEYGEFNMIDVENGQSIAQLHLGSLNGSTGHFDVHNGMVAALTEIRGPQALLLNLDDLSILREITLEGVSWGAVVAYHPDGSRLYVFAQGSTSRDVLFFVIDPLTGRSTKLVRLPPWGFSCPSLCGVNPVAFLRSGRYMAVITGDLYVIDTALDLPLARFRGPWIGVAASPGGDAVYVLNPEGAIVKARLTR